MRSGAYCSYSTVYLRWKRSDTAEAEAEAEGTEAIGEAVACRCWLWPASAATGAGRAVSCFLSGVLSALLVARCAAALLASGFMDWSTGSASLPAQMERHHTVACVWRVRERERERERRRTGAPLVGGERRDVGERVGVDVCEEEKQCITCPDGKSTRVMQAREYERTVLEELALARHHEREHLAVAAREQLVEARHLVLRRVQPALRHPPDAALRLAAHATHHSSIVHGDYNHHTGRQLRFDITRVHVTVTLVKQPSYELQSVKHEISCYVL